MDDEEIFERWVRAHQTGDTDTLDEFMDEDFVFEDEGLPERLDKDQYLALVDQLHRAFPDLGVDPGDPSYESDGTVRWEQTLKATHEQDLDLTDLDLPFFVSTGKEVELDGQQARTRVADGRVTEHVIDDDSPGLGGLIDQLETGLDSIRDQARQAEDQRPRRP